MKRDDDILTTAQVLEEFGGFFSSASQIANLAREGKIEHWRISARNLRFSRGAVQAYLDSKHVSCGRAGDKLKGKLVIA